MMLPSDVALTWDKTFRAYVILYSKDEEQFFKDFSRAFGKLLALGTKRSHLEIHKRAFALFDRDRDGSIDRRELGDALRSFNRALSDADLADIIESADSDGTGTIEFPEFLDIVRPQNATEDAFLDAGS